MHSSSRFLFYFLKADFSSHQWPCLLGQSHPICEGRGHGVGPMMTVLRREAWTGQEVERPLVPRIRAGRRNGSGPITHPVLRPHLPSLPAIQAELSDWSGPSDWGTGWWSQSGDLVRPQQKHTTVIMYLIVLIPKNFKYVLLRLFVCSCV